ncbi:MAG: hypothetical protein LBQ49_01380 [Rickettsiales bacterium]|jgi:hypothetical protein|nr:hypothetical protein [Rickettsiales bacterium]
MDYSALLSSYSAEDYDALEALKVPGLHRWNSAVNLCQSGLPAHTAMLVDPGKSDAVLYGEITEFVRRFRAAGYEYMLIRLDGRHGAVPPPGHAMLTHDYDGIIKQLRAHASSGFVPSIHTLNGVRYSRFGAAAISFVEEDGIVVELIGPGYDGSDLSKGAITPPVVISMKPYSPPLSELVECDRDHMAFYLDIKDEAKILSASDLAAARERRREMRLSFLAKVDNRSAEDEKKWLYDTGQTFLFDREMEYDAGYIMKLFAFAALYAKVKKAHNDSVSSHTLNCQIVRGGRIFFDNMWDRNRR